MPHLACDFGTTNTVLALWDEASAEGIPARLPGLNRLLESGAEEIPVTPTLIHYTANGREWLGQQVHEQRVYDSPTTFKWMKSAICQRNPARRDVHDRRISAAEAAADFLRSVLTLAAAEFEIGDEEIAFTVPVEAYEHYTNWIGDVAASVGMTRFRFIDEPSAAALGYGAHVQPGQVYTVFDFGGGTLDVAIVLIESEEAAAAGRRCRVLGKAGLDLGGSTIDQWLFADVLKRCGRRDSDKDVRDISLLLLNECERAKEQLSERNETEVAAMHPESGMVVGAEYTREHFEDLLEAHGMFEEITRTLDRALNDSSNRGYAKNAVHSVLMLGGSSLIPSVQKTVQRYFGRDRVKLERPLDAVARGAAAFVSGVDFYDHIQHDYAIRYSHPKTGRHEYKLIVHRGTEYPTKKPICEKMVRPTYPGQTELGLAVFEVGEAHSSRGAHGQAMEVVFDVSGAARLSHVDAAQATERSRFWVNQDSPTFLVADPPAQGGEDTFRVEFSIDGNKHLLITACDLRTERTVFKDYPLVKLS